MITFTYRNRFQIRSLNRKIARRARTANDNQSTPQIDPTPPAAAQVVRQPTVTTTLTVTEAKALDAYYTRPHVAKFMANALRTFAPKDAVYLEPSAGGGAILDQFSGAIGLDLCPTRDDIVQADFLTADVAKVAGLTAYQRKRLVIVGNPPFGRASSLAVQFVNKALNLADTVGMIVPFAFGYYEVQRQIVPGARLIVDIVLPKQGYTLAGKSVCVMSRFQIWTTMAPEPGGYVYQGKATSSGRGKKAVMDKARITCRVADDLRQTDAGALECDDFTIERSRGKPMLFNLAVPWRRGANYTDQIARDPTELTPGYEYWMVKVRSSADIETVVSRLLKIDFKAISLNHNHNGQRFVGVDIVRAYSRLKAAESAAVAVPINDNVPTIKPVRPNEPVQVITGDCLDVMASMADGSVDLIVTSPPYNLGNYAGGKPSFSTGSGRGMWSAASIANGYASYSDDMPWPEYVAWQKRVLAECWRLIPDTGAIFYNHKTRPVKGRLVTPLELLPDCVNLRQIITWDRGNGMNFNRSFFRPSSEWILLLAKPRFKLDVAGGGQGDVWRLTHERKNDYPAPFPVDLPLTAINSVSSAKVIFDPFTGAGTTGVAAKMAGRQYIGAELDPGYAATARARIAATDVQPQTIAAKTFPLRKPE